MSTTFTVTELNAGRTGEVADDGSRSYVREFSVVASNGSASPGQVLSAPGIPRYGDFYTTLSGYIDAALVVQTIKAQIIDETEDTWRVTASYSNKFPKDKLPESKAIENPLARPATVRWGGVRKQIALFDDIDGEPIVNSAYRPFDPPIERERVNLKLTIQRNESEFDAVTMLDFIDTVNNAEWYGFAARRVKCTDISADRQFENGIYFWSVTYEFEIIPKRIDEEITTWDLRVLDAGYEEYDSIGDSWSRITDLGRPITTPALLDGEGGRLTPATADPVFLTFRVFKERDFGDLHLT